MVNNNKHNSATKIREGWNMERLNKSNVIRALLFKLVYAWRVN